MRIILSTIPILGLITASAFGQAPQTGDFTEIEAKSRFEASGYSNVHGLYKSSLGAWHATATKNGQSLNLGLDVQGRVGIE
jgi:hypothetical protein